MFKYIEGPNGVLIFFKTLKELSKKLADARENK